MATWTSAQLRDIDEISDGRVPWRPVRHHFGIASFGLNVFTGREVGDRIINEHDETEDGNEELYFVHTGRARFELDGESLEATPGTLVYAPPEVRRTAFAEEPNTTIVVVGGRPGHAYEPSGWEVWAPFDRAPGADAGDGIRKLAALLRTFDLRAEIVVRAIRSSADIVDAALAGAQAIAAPPALLRALDADSAARAGGPG